MKKSDGIEQIFNSTGISVDRIGVPTVSDSLPMFYKKRYNFIEYRIEGHNKSVLIIEIIQKMKDLQELVSNLEFLSRNFDGELVVKFDELSSFWRMQLIRERISFIMKEEVFLPFIGALLKPNYEKTVVYSDQFTPAQQHIFISILNLSKSQSSITPKDLVKETQLSLPTVYRSLDLMSHLGIFKNVNKNKHNTWLLAMDTESIWNKGKELMKSPVLSNIILSKSDFNSIQESLQPYISGNEALAYYTNLEGFGTNTYAISNATYIEQKDLITSNAIENINSNDEMRYHTSEFVSLEVWSYGPIVRTESKGKYVDPISLFLLNKSNPDPRVQSELDSLLNKLISVS